MIAKLVILVNINYLQLQVVLTIRCYTTIKMDRWLQRLVDLQELLTVGFSTFSTELLKKYQQILSSKRLFVMLISPVTCDIAVKVMQTRKHTC